MSVQEDEEIGGLVYRQNGSIWFAISAGIGERNDRAPDQRRYLSAWRTYATFNPPSTERCAPVI
jgi:hypothetical protein